MSDAPIIILGAPRSGTTFLGDVLAKHSSLRYFIEPSPVWRYGNESCSDALNATHASPVVVDRIRSYFATECQREGKSRILEKTPQNCLRVPFIDKIFPDARYVHIIRDGYESSLSIREHWLNKGKGLAGVRISQRLREIRGTQYLKYGWQFFKRCMFAKGNSPVVMWGPLIPGLAKMRKELSLLEVSAMQWKLCTEWACMAGRQIDSARYMEVCLSDLDRGRLMEILEFLDLTPEGDVLEFFDSNYSRSATRHRLEAAGDEDLASASRIIDPTMEWLRESHPSLGD